MTNFAKLTLFTLSLLAIGGLFAGGSSAAETGEWRIEPTPGGFAVTWVAPEALPMGSDRPEILLDGQSLGPASISAGGRELTAIVPGNDAPASDRLDVRLSGRLLDEPSFAPDGSDDAVWIAPATAAPSIGYDPGRAGLEPIRISNYSAPSFKYGGLKRKLEMKGHVVAPTDQSVAASAPLVVFLHGRHSTCYRPGGEPSIDGGWPCRKGTRPIPSQLGYEYLQRTLASQGFVTVSIAANSVNAQDDSLADAGAGARSAVIRRHLDLWSSWVASGTRKADLNRVILIGHSRGGEGVNRASETIPTTAPYRVAGQVLLAPTNFARQTAAYIPTITFLPYCDGDVSDLQGQAYTDVSIGLAAGDNSLKSSLVMFGANHNFFNTEWTPGIAKAPADDDSWAPPHTLCGKGGRTRLTAAEQRQKARSYVAGAVQLMTGTDSRPLALFDGSRARAGTVTKAETISNSVGGGKHSIVPGRDAALDATSGNAWLCLGYTEGTSPKLCGRGQGPGLAPHWPGMFPAGIPTRPAVEMRWRKPGRSATLRLSQTLDLTGKSDLDLRVIVAPRLRTARLGVALTDADGTSIELIPAQNGRINSMPADGGRFGSTQGRLLARTMRVPLPATSGPVDLSRIDAIKVTGLAKPPCAIKCSKISRIWLLDISTRSGNPIPAVTADRLPLIRARSVRQTEGNGNRSRVLEVPFEVTGEILDPAARFKVSVNGETGAGTPPRPQTVTLSPGQTSGTIKVPYRSNNVADPDREITLNLFPIRGAIPVTSAVISRLVDDDPKPKLRIKAVKRSVAGGRPIRWLVSLTKPVGWTAPIDAQFRSVPGLPQLTVGDLPDDWVKSQLFGLEGPLPDTPLTQSGLWLSFPVARVAPRWTEIRIPTKRLIGGTVRGVRLRLSVPGLTPRLTPPIRIRPS